MPYVLASMFFASLHQLGLDVCCVHPWAVVGGVEVVVGLVAGREA